MLSGASLQVTKGIIIQPSSKTEEPEQSVSIATPDFRPRRRSFKSIMKEDIFYTAPKRVNPVKVEAVEINQMKFTKSWQKRKISFAFWQDISRRSFLLMNRRCLVGLVSTIKC